MATRNDATKPGDGMPAADAPIPDDIDRVFQMIMGSMMSQAVRTLTLMSVAEHLAAGPLDAEEIARRESADPAMTRRLLRAGVALGLLTFDTERATFAGTPMLSVLHGDSPASLKHYALGAPSRSFWLPSLTMPETVREGVNHVTEALGAQLFEYFAEHPEEAANFGMAMTNLSVPIIRDAVGRIEAPSGLAVDVGGAEGAFVVELVERNPGLTGTVLELPHAVPAARAAAERRGLADRVSAVTGDFFVAVPEADIYLLKFVLHDWDDEACVRILRNIRRAMRPDGRLYVVEMAISDADPSPTAALARPGHAGRHGRPGKDPPAVRTATRAGRPANSAGPSRHRPLPHDRGGLAGSNSNVRICRVERAYRRPVIPQTARVTILAGRRSGALRPCVDPVAVGSLHVKVRANR
jgi:O-methyltransferase domain/Dimerisation domain